MHQGVLQITTKFRVCTKTHMFNSRTFTYNFYTNLFESIQYKIVRYNVAIEDIYIKLLYKSLWINTVTPV
jgi:hypothetical protein